MKTVAIIGGGIQGAGIAQAAASCGYNVKVFERSALACGTSSRSSKLIHGGLRYLETYQFNLVRECLYERKILLKNAPELVQLKKFMLPFYENSRRSQWQYSLGLNLYRLLGGLNYQKINIQKWENKDNIRHQYLKTMFSYYDAQTDDIALTQAVMYSACEMGAQLIMPATVDKIRLSAKGGDIDYSTPTQQHHCFVDFIVNASGPWVNLVLAKVNPTTISLDYDLVQGTHCIIKGNIEHPYFVQDLKQQRLIFILPYQNKILVGTTEHKFTGNLEDIKPSPEEITYLKVHYQYYFPNRPFTISKTFAGVRVLPHDHKSPFNKSRETQILTDNPDDPRMITIYGGKLTSYRATAEKVINKINAKFAIKQTIKTKNIALKPVELSDF